MLRRRFPVVLLALLCAVAVAPASAAAQTDAALGCTYSIKPDEAGPVGYKNVVVVTVDGCSYAWDAIEVNMNRGTSSTGIETPRGYQCDDGGFDVLCVRRESSTVGTILTIRPQCPRGGQTRFTLAITDPAGTRRVGAPKSLPCSAPPVKVLAPPKRQAMGTAFSRGIVSRFSCRTRCTAKVTLIDDSSAGRRAGRTVVKRRGTGPQTARVRVSSAFQRRWRRRSAVWVNVVVTITASTGEQVTFGHDVRLRR